MSKFGNTIWRIFPPTRAKITPKNEDFSNFGPFLLNRGQKEDIRGHMFLRGQKEDFKVLKTEKEEKEDKRGRAWGLSLLVLMFQTQTRFERSIRNSWTIFFFQLGKSQRFKEVWGRANENEYQAHSFVTPSQPENLLLNENASLLW